MSATEEIITEIRNIWLEELELPEREVHKITRDADFIEIGGDSMKFIRICGRLESAYDVTIDDARMSELRSIAAQAAFIESQRAQRK